MPKSNLKSDSLRTEGNAFYKQKDYYEAMLKYNESLCFAEPGSEMMGLAYANRSAIYFEMKLYGNCLINVVSANKNQCPEMQQEMIKKREEKCLALMKKSSDDSIPSDNFFRLSYSSHKKVPYIADCLKLEVNETYGRHIVTSQPLKPGDVVAIEKPFCKVLQKRFAYQLCSWCFNSNLMDLIPCHHCTKTMFCSSDCEKMAFESFHKYECPLREMTSNLSSTMHMALHTFFVALSLFDGSCEALQNYLSGQQQSVFDLDDPFNLQHTLLAINSLITNEESDVDKNMFEDIFQISAPLNVIWASHGKFIASFLHKQIQIGTLNYHEIYAWPLKRGNLQDDEVDNFTGYLAYQRGVTSAGNGSYPFCSLLNHHCAPNVTKVFIDDKLVVVVQRPIKKGEQLFDNYGYHFTNVPRDHRQLKLLKQYKFKCSCDACVNDWPLLPSLKVRDKMCLNKAKKVCRELSLASVNRKKAISKYNELCDILNKNQTNFPSLEVCSIMQSAAAYLEMIFKPQMQFP